MPEFNSSWFDRLSFSWLNDLLCKGAARQLQYSDLYKLDITDMPVANWRRYLHHRKPDRSLLVTIALAFGPEFLLQILFSIIVCILNFAGPFFLQRILRSIDMSNRSSLHINTRSLYLDAFGLLFFNLLASLIVNQLFWNARRVGICLNGLLVAELTSKTLRRRGKGSLEEKSKTKDAKKDDPKASSAADGKIMNLLTTDFQRVVEVTAYLTSIYSQPLTLIIGIWYMYQLIGVSALVGLSLACVYVPLSKMLVNRLAALEEELNAISDERVSMITEVLQGIKAVKLFGWESRFVSIIAAQREYHLKYLWKMAMWQFRIGIATSLGPMLILLVIFTTYVVVLDNKLTAEVAFASISVFQLVRIVFERMPEYLNWAINGYVSLCRIDSYLGQPQAQDLEKRVALEFSDALGFECADLEWESPEGAKDNSPHQDDLTAFSLKNIDIQFPIDGLSIVAGPTGSGKSSLLSALIGEMTLTRGRILLPTVNASMVAASDGKYRDVIELSNEGLAINDIAYVAQEAWLRNATIRENILFGEPYNKDRYEEVLRACALKPDLRILNAGDMTEIGERGVTLSGGQKQRVALARAVYSSRRILLIDDCLSAVDAHTGKHILMECLLNKTSLMQGRTRVLVTHHVAMCMPFAQFLVVMDKGKVSLKGTPVELQMQGDLTKALAEVEGNQDKDTISKKKPKAKASEYNIERLQKIAQQKGLDPNSDLSAFQGILVVDEHREEGFVKFKVWKTYMSACGSKAFLISSILLLVLWQAVVIAQSYWIRIWVNSNSSNTNASIAGSTSIDTPSLPTPFHSTGPIYGSAMYLTSVSGSYINSTQHSPIYWLGIYVLIGLVAIFGRAIQNIFIFQAAIDASRTLHTCLLQAVFRATPRFFNLTPVGRIISRFSRDMHTIDEVIINNLMSWISGMIAVLGVYAVTLSVTPMFIFIALAILIVYMAIAHYYLNTSRELKRLESNSMSPLLSLFSELIQGVSTIRAFGAKHYYIKEALNRISAHNRTSFLTLASNRWFAVRIDCAGAAVSFSCALFILFNLDWMDASLAGFVLSYALTFSERMFWVVRNYSTNEFNMNAVERVRQYTLIEQEAALESKPEHKPSALWPKSGDIQIENLVAEYMPGVPVLHGISLSVKHGEKVGVVGRTGAGKSTLSLALLRFVEASGGRIVLDGVDISKIGLEDLRRNVTIIPQDPVLFNGTIRFNLDPFNEYPDEILWDALRRTHLVRENSSHSPRAATSINASEAGIGDAEALAVERMSGIFNSLGAEIKENGQNLSLGQRQLVALARALVRRSRLIIMDEATASVDFDTDDRIQRTIRGYEFANSTLLCIAHRLRTIIDYDRVLVLDKGKVAEFDTPYNLLQNRDGIFRSMCEKSGEYGFLAVAADRKSNNKPI
ncbi:P-loop containing nucleoside triphosphate hydrolase protein [Coemansia spiralis]|nr:P-loop containing nucleoside triphosphate hydrolase protein [Coemansia spiralis]